MFKRDIKMDSLNWEAAPTSEWRASFLNSLQGGWLLERFSTYWFYSECEGWHVLVYLEWEALFAHTFLKNEGWGKNCGWDQGSLLGLVSNFYFIFVPIICLPINQLFDSNGYFLKWSNGYYVISPRLEALYHLLNPHSFLGLKDWYMPHHEAEDIEA